jgi:DNA polymerase-3 subunit alpha
VTLVLLLEGGRNEVEVRLPGRYPVNPQAAGAIKAIPGIVAVEPV